MNKVLITVFVFLIQIQLVYADSDQICLVLEKKSGVVGEVCQNKSDKKIYWFPHCSKDQIAKDKAVTRKQKTISECASFVYSSSDPAYVYAKSLFGLAQLQNSSNDEKSNLATSSSFCPEAKAVNADDPWISYSCEANPQMYGTEINHYKPRVSILYNTRPINYQDRTNNSFYNSYARPILMSGSAEYQTSTDSNVLLCEQNRVRKISNPVVSEDYKTLTLYFDGSKRWDCTIERGPGNSGESILEKFNTDFALDLKLKQKLNADYLNRKPGSVASVNQKSKPIKVKK